MPETNTNPPFVADQEDDIQTAPATAPDNLPTEGSQIVITPIDKIRNPVAPLYYAFLLNGSVHRYIQGRFNAWTYSAVEIYWELTEAQYRDMYESWVLLTIDDNNNLILSVKPHAAPRLIEEYSGLLKSTRQALTSICVLTPVVKLLYDNMYPEENGTRTRGVITMLVKLEKEELKAYRQCLLHDTFYKLIENLSVKRSHIAERAGKSAFQNLEDRALQFVDHFLPINADGDVVLNTGDHIGLIKEIASELWVLLEGHKTIEDGYTHDLDVEEMSALYLEAVANVVPTRTTPLGS